MNQIMLLLGINKSGFSKGLHDATVEAKAFGKEWGNMKKLFAAGGLLTTAAFFFRSIIDHAQETRDRLEKMGEPVPGHIRSVAEFGDALKQVKDAALDAAVYIVSGWTQIGEAIGSGINRLLGVSEAQENIAMRAFKDAEAAEQRLAKAREENSPEKIAAAEERLAKVRRDNAFEQASTHEKINILLAEQLDLRRLVDGTGEKSIKGAEARIALEKNLNELRKLGIAIEKEKADAEAAAAKAAAEQENAANQRAAEAARKRQEAAEAAAEAEERIAAAAKIAADEAARAARIKAEQVELNQKIRSDFMAGITMGGYSSAQIQDASDAALRQALARNNERLPLLQQNPGSAFDFGNSLTITRLENENRRIQAELAKREGLRRSVDFLGVEGARRQFGGDPLAFDRLVDQFTRQQDRTDEQIGLLRDIKDQLRGGDQGNLPGSIITLADRIEGGLRSVSETNRDVARAIAPTRR
jgi:hypothetical protein